MGGVGEVEREVILYCRTYDRRPLGGKNAGPA